MTDEGRGNAVDHAAWLGRLLQGDPAPPVPPHDRRAIVAARTATVRFLSDPDEAWIAWRRLLAEPLDGTAPSVLWDPVRPPAPSSSGSLTAELLLALAHGLLGLRPDAAVGRIRIAPRIPSHLTSFEAVGIPVGPCSLGLRYTMSENVARYELVPEVAPIPPLVVLEPSVRGAVRASRVDGEAAELDVRTTGERTVAPVQLPLDGVRILEIETYPES